MKFFIQNSQLVILVSLAFVIMGLRGLFHLQRESFPPVDFATVIISTVYPGSSPAEVEELITSKIESKIRAVEHLKDAHSESRPGLSLITVRIDMDHADTEQVVNKLHQAVQNVQGLPPEVLDPPQLESLDSQKKNPLIYLYVVGPDEGRARDELAYRLKTRLERLSGIVEVQLGNYRERELSVLLSKKKMERHYISSSDVIAALEKKKMDFPSGYLESDKRVNMVRILGKPRTIKDLESSIVRSNFSGKKILVKDVAQVKDHQVRQTQSEHFYKSEKGQAYKLSPVTSLSLLKTAQADALDLLVDIEKKLNLFKKNLKGEYKILTGFNEGEHTKRRLIAVINNALTGFVLVFIVFFLLLPFRVGFMVSWSLPLSLLGTFAFLPFMGVSFNILTMLAFVICIGMLVDNSVVISEYYSRIMSRGQYTPKSAALLTVQRLRAPVTATALTTIVAFVPMLVTTGVMGKFIKWIPIVVSLALLISLFESFCLLPGRLKWLSKKKAMAGGQSLSLRWFDRLESLFEKALVKLVKRKYLSLGGIFFLIVLTAFVFKLFSRVDLFSSKTPEYYTARLEALPNSPLHLIEDKAKKTAGAMRSAVGEEVVDWISLQSDFEGANILLKARYSALRRLKYRDILAQLRKTANKENIKSLRFGVLVAGPPVDKPLKVAIQSNDRKKIQDFISAVSLEMEKIPGLLNLESNPDTERGTEYQVQADPEILARLGLSFQSVGLALRTALEGRIITELTEKNESFYIRIRHDETQMSSVEDLRKIKIREMFGRLISLGEIAEVKEVRSDPYRKSYNFEPVVFLEADVNEKRTTSMAVNAQAKKIIEKKIRDYPSLTFKMIGQQETTEESLKSLKNASIMAVFAIFAILIVLFKSFLISFLILSCIPLGLIGVIWAFFLHGRDLNFFAMIGLVGLAGVVVNSAIILVSFIRRLQEEKPRRPLSEVAVEASKIRFRPIMITNLTTLGGLLPTAYGVAGFEPLLMPMTLALFWGLLTATILTLIWIPCALLCAEDVKKLFRRFYPL